MVPVSTPFGKVLKPRPFFCETGQAIHVISNAIFADPIGFEPQQRVGPACNSASFSFYRRFSEALYFYNSCKRP